MLKVMPHSFTLLLLALSSAVCFGQAPTMARFPIEVQRAERQFYLVAAAEITGFRVALYDQAGALRAESAALTDAPLRWQVPKLQAGIYLCVFWLRRQERAEKQLARLEVRATKLMLQSAEQYLQAVEPPASVLRGTPEYRAVAHRAYLRGVAAIPLFRTATKILPYETTAYLFLVQAMRIKYARFEKASLAPTRPNSVVVGRKKRERIVERKLPQPTPQENQAMLGAARKALAVAKTCAEKTEALRWLAAIQAELNQPDEQLATLEQITQTSCATQEIRVATWYTIGVSCWQCCYALTTRSADAKRLAAEPFHHRTFTKVADQQRFDACWQKGMTALETTLALMPNYAEALSYQSLLYREQQKTAASPAARSQAGATAERLSQQAVELFRQQRAR